MRRYLLVALWPVGLAAIAVATVIAARRAPASPPVVAADDRVGGGEMEAPHSADPIGDDGLHLADVTHIRVQDSARPSYSAVAASQTSSHRQSDPAAALPAWVPDLVKLGVLSCASGLASYGAMALLGPPIVNNGPLIDEPIVRWISGHQVRRWAAIMERLNKVGNTWTTWGAAGTAAVCLGVTWREQRWLPPSALGAAVLVDHYTTLALRHKFNRPGPPRSPLGTYPSGGCDRVVLFYGLIAQMLWREFSGGYSGKVWAVGSISALSFNEAYCRAYLSKHWFTDIMSGLVYGAVLLAPFSAAVHVIAGPANLESVEGLPPAPLQRENVYAASVLAHSETVLRDF